MEVAEGIHRIEAPLGDRVNALYLLTGRSAAMLVDTGLKDDPAGSLVPYLADIGLDIGDLRYALNTHADVDHMGGNRAIRALAPTAVLMCGEPDRPMIEDLERMISERYGEFGADHGLPLEEAMAAWCRESAQDAPIDIGLVGGERIDLSDGWRVEIVHTPGHSLGSMSVWDPRSRALIVGDAVLGAAVPTSGGRPAFPPTYRHVDAYLGSIAHMGALDADLLLASHESVRRGEAVAAFLELSRAYVEHVDAAVVAALRRGRRSLRELTDELGPSLGDWPAEAHTILRYPLLGHLERLVSRGLAATERIDGSLAYRWMGA